MSNITYKRAINKQYACEAAHHTNIFLSTNQQCMDRAIQVLQRPSITKMYGQDGGGVKFPVKTAL